MRPAIILYFFLSLLACTSNKQKELEYVLEIAGENRSELEKVLDHYREDPLKQEAARFLIVNMPGHSTFSNSKTENFYVALDTLLTYHRNVAGNPDSINKLITQTGVLSEKLQNRQDLHLIKADYLINNIDHAFDVWTKEPYARHLSFDEFCEYLLPYRVENEPLEYWRDSITPNYNYIDSLGYFDGSEYSAFQACKILNDRLRDECRPWQSDDLWPITKSYTLLKKMPFGKCSDYAILATFVMRAKGIPVAIDYTPQWPFGAMGHTWNVVKVNNGNNVVFGGVDTNPGDPHRPDSKTAKIYRKTYAPNRHSIGYMRGKEPVPETLRSPFIKDVTDEYFKGSDIRITPVFSPSEKRKYMYLHVFDNKQWVAVSFAEIKKGTALFEKMGRDILYLPGYYIQGQEEAAAYPFFLDLRGNMHTLKPDATRLKKLKLTRKYPFNNRQNYSSQRMVGGQIQGSDNPDFKNASTFFTIKDNPLGARIKVDINPTNKHFRYWRYLSPNGSSGNIAELQFYQDTTYLNPQGEIKGTPGSYENKGDTFEKAFDGDPLTFVDGHKSDGCWVGIDFGKPISVTSVGYTPRHDDNNVVPGSQYELLYYGEEGWVSLGRQTATDYFVEYDSIPENALLWLRNLSRGKEERIFTHNDEHITWW